MSGTKKSNVVKLPTGNKSASLKKEQAIKAEELVAHAMTRSGHMREKIALAAIELSEDCVPAYILIADEQVLIKDQVEWLRKSVQAAERQLGANWAKKYAGVCWMAHETRPIMRCMAKLAIALQELGELDEALNLYRKMMELNPSDSQGIRYFLAACLYEAKQDDELDKLLSKYKGEPAAELAYIRALYMFRKNGPDQAKKALLDAYKCNKFIPLYLSDVMEMPDESPASIGFRDESEAVAFVMDHGRLWRETSGSTKWLAQTIGSKLRIDFKDAPELVEDAIESLVNDFN